MIRFSAALVVVAIGILVGGVATSRLSLVYVAIAVSAAALVVLAIGVVLKRKELFGEQPQTPAADAGATGVGAGATIGQPALVGQAAAGAVGDRSGQSAFGQDAPVTGPPVTVARDWPAWDADSRPAQSGARATGSDVPAGGWYQEPDQATPWRLPSRPDAPTRGRHAGHLRSDAPPSSAPTSAAASAAPAPPAPPAPPTQPVPQVQPASPDWPPPPSPPSGPDRPLPRSWFDRTTPPEPDADADAPLADGGSKADGTDDSAADQAVEDGATADVTATFAGIDDASDDVAEHGAGTGAADAATDSGPEPSQASVTGEASADIEDPDSEQAEAKAGSSGPAEADAATEAPAPNERQDAGQAAERERDDLKRITVVPGVPRYHNANCILIRFMGEDDLQKMTVPEATAAGCTPCRACQPDSATE